MFTVKHYVPVLKGKDGEFGALKKTSSVAISKMTPVIELMGFTPLVLTKVTKKEKSTPDFDSHIKKEIKALVDCWGNNGPIFIDLHLIPSPSLYSIASGDPYLFLMSYIKTGLLQFL